MGLDVKRDGDGGTGNGLMEDEAGDMAGEADGKDGEDGEDEVGDAVRYDAVAIESGIA